jgi:hypothetical protein
MVDGRIGAMGTPGDLKQQFKVDSIDDLFVQLVRPGDSVLSAREQRPS